MASYLLQASYTPQAWATLVSRPHDRSAVIKSAVKKLGGKVNGLWLSFGEHDVVVLLDMPDTVSAAAIAMAAASGGAIQSVKTTPLLTVAEGVEALKKAAESGYTPPSA
jgi:uncharacterized protein with GYD domain